MLSNSIRKWKPAVVFGIRLAANVHLGPLPPQNAHLGFLLSGPCLLWYIYIYEQAFSNHVSIAEGWDSASFF